MIQSIIDAIGNLGVSNYAVFWNTTSTDQSSMTNAIKHFIFERFEVKNGMRGFWFLGDSLQFRYMYIHDCDRENHDEAGGIKVPMLRDSIIEYCWFAGNSNSGNQADILIYADYNDTSDNAYDGLAFDPNVCIKGNIIVKFSGSFGF